MVEEVLIFILGFQVDRLLQNIVTMFNCKNFSSLTRRTDAHALIYQSNRY